MKIYTKRGDDGSTSLIGGKRVSKASLRIECYGTVDELNAFVGALRDSLSDEALRKELSKIQYLLFNIGSNLALSPDSDYEVPQVTEEEITALETAMDKMNEKLQPLRNFILPGGSSSISNCHIARTVCRRAERLVVLLNENEMVNKSVIKFLNRLSDYLFVVGRKIAADNNIEEYIWKGN